MQVQSCIAQPVSIFANSRNMESARARTLEMLEQLRSRTGLSYSRIAAKAGLSASTLTRYVNSDDVKHELSTPTLERLKLAFPEFFSATEPKATLHAETASLTSTAQPAPMPVVAPGQWVRDVPVVGGGLAAPLHVVQAGAHLDIEQTSLDFGADPDFAPRPPAFATNRQLYCVYVWGDSMVPRYDAGDRLYVDPRRPPNVGDDVVVQLRGEEGDQVVVALIKRLARRNGTTIELQQYNPATNIVVETSRVASIHRVVPWRELL